MKLLDKYILSELRGPFAFGVAIFTIALVASRILDLSRLLINYGAPVTAVGKVLILSLPGIMVMSFPMAMLVATLLAFGRLSSDSEMTAMQAGGISLLRCLLTTLCMAMLVSIAAIVLSETLVPRANSLSEAVIQRLYGGHGLSGEQKNILLQEKSGGRSRMIVFARSFDPQRQELRGVTITEIGAGGAVLGVTSADRAAWDGREWKLLKGFSQRVSPDGDGYWAGFEVQRFKLKDNPGDILARRKRPEDMSIAELKWMAASLADEGSRKTAPWLTQMHLKIAVPFASFIFALVGLPLALRPHRSSSSMGFGLSLVVIFVYYVLTTVGLRLGQSGNMAPWAAAWLANGIIGIAGAALVGRAAGQVR